MLINRIIEYGIISLAIFTPLAFGSVEIWAYTVIELVVLLLVTFLVLRAIPILKSQIPNPQSQIPNPQSQIHNLQSELKYPILLISTFVILIFFQIIPLPSEIIRIISPKTYNLYTDLSLNNRSFMTISLYPYATRIEILKLLSYMGIFMLTISIINTKEQTSRLIKVLIIFGFILSLFGIIQKATGTGKIYWFRELTHGGSPFGPFVNRNHFAGHIGMIIPLSIAYVFTIHKKEKQIIYGFMALIMTLAVFYSTSRGGVTTFLAGLVLFVVVMLFKRLKNKGLWIITAFVICLSGYLIYLGIIDPVMERFIKTDISSEQRFLVWKGAWNGFIDFLTFGSGLGTFQYIFPMYKYSGINLYYDHAHNDYFEFFLETGMSGVLIFILFLWYLISSWKDKLPSWQADNPETEEADKPVSWQAKKIENRFYIRLGLLTSIVVILLHSIVDFNLHIPSNAVLFSLILGLYARGGISDV